MSFFKPKYETISLEQKIKPLHIALCGQNLSQSNEALKEILKKSGEEVQEFHVSNAGGFLIFNDGTIISCLSELSPESHFRGCRYDQIFVLEGAKIPDALKECLSMSCVPKDFLIQKLT